MSNDLQPRGGASPGVAGDWWPLTEQAKAFGFQVGPLGESLGQLARACGGLKLQEVRGVGGWLEATLIGPKARLSIELGDVDWGQGDPLTGPVLGPDLATTWAKLAKGDDQARHDRHELVADLAGLASGGMGLQEAFEEAFQGRGFLGIEAAQEALVGLGFTLRALAPLAPVVDAIAAGAGPSAWAGLPKALREGVAR